MKKRILTLIMLTVLLLSSCNYGTDGYKHTTDAPAQTDKKPHEADAFKTVCTTDFYSLSADSADSGLPCKLKLSYGNKEIVFDGLCPAENDTVHFYFVDVTEDNAKDAILEYTVKVNENEGLRQRELYVFDGKTDKLIPMDPVRDYVKNKVAFQSDSENYYVCFEDEKVKVEKSAYSFVAAEDFAESISFSGVDLWGIDDGNRLYYSAFCSLTKDVTDDSGNCGSIYAYLEFENGRFRVDELEFYASHYNGKIINFETNSPAWRLWYNTDHLVLESADGKEFRFGSTIGDEGVKNGIPDENSLQFFPYEDDDAEAYINGSYAAVVYKSARFTADQPIADRVFIVDLTSGLICKHIAIDATEILKSNKLPENTLDDYKYTDTSPIQYQIEADVELQNDCFILTFELETYDEKIELSHTVKYDPRQ